MTKKWRSESLAWADDMKKGLAEESVRLFSCGATENRTRDTRIFSPLLYQLSYGTSRAVISDSGCKDTYFFILRKFFKKKSIPIPKIALPLQHQRDRNVAQLVAHYVRDVGVGRSSRLIPTGWKRGSRDSEGLFC